MRLQTVRGEAGQGLARRGAALMGALASLRLTEMMAEDNGTELAPEVEETILAIKEEAQRRGFWKQGGA